MKKRSLAVSIAALGFGLACTGHIGGTSAPIQSNPDAGVDGGGISGADASTDAGADAGVNTGSDGGADASTPDGGLCAAPFTGSGTVVASQLSYPRRLAGSAARLYVTEVGVLNKPMGRVLAVESDGGVTELATGRSSPDAIAADATYLYWVDEGGLWRYTLSSGALVSLDTKVNAALQGNTSVALTSGAVLYATGTNFLELSKTNGSGNRTLFQGAPGSVVRGAAISGSTGYFLYSGASDAGLYQVSLNGSPNPQLVSAAPADGTDLAVTANAFFWGTGSGGKGAVETMPRAGGPVTDLATGLAGPRAVLPLDGGFTYFQDSTAGSGPTTAFFQVASPCASPAPVGPVGQGPGDVLYDADAGTLFFTSYGGSGSGFVGRVP